MKWQDYKSSIKDYQGIMRLHIIVNFARIRGKTVVFVMGTPGHNNLGDQAISWAETDFIKHHLTNPISINIPYYDFIRWPDKVLKSLVQPTDILCGHGGGNMGEVYLAEEECRRRFIQLFPNNKIVIFPQTIHFTYSKTGRRELEKTKAAYSKHKSLTIIARERVSYKQMLKFFPDNEIILTPDIVLSMSQSRVKQKREGLLICLRNDLESKLSQEDKKTISDFSNEHFNKITYTDTLSHAKFFAVRSKRRAVQSKLNEFKSAKLVVTDRLHGMVFSVITGTPCIAMANFNHKVENTYKWIEYLPYISFCKNVNELDGLLKQMNINKTYEYNPAHFNNYWNTIRNAIVRNAE